MRKELEFPQVDESALGFVQELIDEVARNGSEKALAELNRVTGEEHDKAEFNEYWNWTDVKALARTVLTPEPPCVKDLTQDEAASLVTTIRDCLAAGEDHKASYYTGLIQLSLSLDNAMEFLLAGDSAEAAAGKLLEAAGGGAGTR